MDFQAAMHYARTGDPCWPELHSSANLAAARTHVYLPNLQYHEVRRRSAKSCSLNYTQSKSRHQVASLGHFGPQFVHSISLVAKVKSEIDLQLLVHNTRPG